MKTVQQHHDYNDALVRSVNTNVWFYTNGTLVSLIPFDNARKIYFLDLTGQNLADYQYMIKNSIDMM